MFDDQLQSKIEQHHWLLNSTSFFLYLIIIPHKTDSEMEQRYQTYKNFCKIASVGRFTFKLRSCCNLILVIMNSTDKPNSFLILHNFFDRFPSFELFNELLKHNKKRNQFKNLLLSIFKNLFICIKCYNIK